MHVVMPVAPVMVPMMLPMMLPMVVRSIAVTADMAGVTLVTLVVSMLAIMPLVAPGLVSRRALDVRARSRI